MNRSNTSRPAGRAALCLAPLLVLLSTVAGATSGMAETSTDAAVLSRPLATGEVLQMVPRGTTVELVRHATNAEGAWWYVRIAGQGGWMNASVLNVGTGSSDAPASIPAPTQRPEAAETPHATRSAVSETPAPQEPTAHRGQAPEPVPQADSDPAPTSPEEPSADAFIDAGLALRSFSSEDTAGNSFDPENGSGVHLTAGLRFNPGLVLRGRLGSTTHDGGRFCFAGGCAGFMQEAEVEETQVGILFERMFKPDLGARAGAGYERLSIEFAGSDFVTDGVFLETAVLLGAGPNLKFDLGASVHALKDDFDNDVSGLDVQLGAIYDVGPFDIGLSWRGLFLYTEFQGGSEDTGISEARLTIGFESGP